MITPFSFRSRATAAAASLALAGLLATPLTHAAEPETRVETKAQRDARMQWWREARFGMFVHWGLYSGLAGTWDGKPVATKGGMEWIQQRVGADTDTYAQRAMPLFKPAPGFAREWAALAKAAGCRYIVFTTKHHDGFALHDSKVSDFDAGSVLHHDLVKEIVDAARAEGLRVGFYHSVIDWHHDQYAYARSKQLPHPQRGKPYPNGERDHARYVDYLHKEVEELVSNYGPVDVLWWDYSAQDFQGEEAWRAFELMSLVCAKQPGIIMNNRLFRSPEAGWSGMGTGATVPRLEPKYGDFLTPEQHIPATGMPGLDWETCMTLNTTWGYSDHDHAWKSDEALIRNLVDIASKGGNYLLNIGPKGDGSIPAETIKSFRAIGAWMKTNGEAIYGTTASPFANLSWGRCTRKGSTLYLHVFDWPKDGVLTVPLQNKVVRATLLAAPTSRLNTTADADAVKIQVPANAPDAIATVIALQIEGEPRVVASAPMAEAH
jgi:alpha-L-fucosidase